MKSKKVMKKIARLKLAVMRGDFVGGMLYVHSSPVPLSCWHSYASIDN
jgi:hypothetical protein